MDLSPGSAPDRDPRRRHPRGLGDVVQVGGHAVVRVASQPRVDEDRGGKHLEAELGRHPLRRDQVEDRGFHVAASGIHLLHRRQPDHRASRAFVEEETALLRELDAVDRVELLGAAALGRCRVARQPRRQLHFDLLQVAPGRLQGVARARRRGTQVGPEGGRVLEGVGTRTGDRLPVGSVQSRVEFLKTRFRVFARGQVFGFDVERRRSPAFDLDPVHQRPAHAARGCHRDFQEELIPRVKPRRFRFGAQRVDDLARDGGDFGARFGFAGRRVERGIVAARGVDLDPFDH